MKTVFENRGAIDPRAIKTQGISAKEGERPIGHFGTGIKYAIAILLRTGHKITIWSGMERLEFGTKNVTIRNQDFQIVTMNGEELGFTTHLGCNWEMWMAYRELYCNAIDEGGEVGAYNDDGVPDPRPDMTFVIVDGDDFLTQHYNRALFILEGEPLFKGAEADVYVGETKHVFYRGIRVGSLPGFSRKGAFTYNITRKIELTEDRTIKHDWEVHAALANTITHCQNKDFIRKVVTGGEDAAESHVILDCAAGTPSPAFLETVADVSKTDINSLGDQALQFYSKHTARLSVPTEAPITAPQQDRLNRCVAFAKAIGFEVDRYPIVMCEGLGEDTLAMAREQKIWIARRVFETSNQLLAHALIEEFVHLSTGFTDHSRALQSHLFQKIVSMGEEHVLKETL